MKKIFLLIVTSFLLVQCYAQFTVDTAIVPQYACGLGRHAKLNTHRLPFYAWVQLSGLHADSTYIYSCAMDTAPNTLKTGAGQTIWIDYPHDTFYTYGTVNFSNPYRSGRFKADASGKFKGWFSVVPDNNYRFKAGDTVYLKILTNNGTSAAADTFVTQATPVKYPIRMLNFFDSSVVNRCSFFYDSTFSKPKSFVFLYDNVNGNGRPISSAVVEKEGINLINPITGVQYIANSYRRVQYKNSFWGTIVPDTLNAGIRRLEYRYFGSGIVDTIFPTPKDTQGIWPTGVVTQNPRNDTAGIEVCSLCQSVVRVAINNVQLPDTFQYCNKTSLQNVKVLVLNNSTVPINKFYLSYSLNGGPITIENVGNLYIQGVYAHVNYASYLFKTPLTLNPPSSQAQRLKIWVSVPANQDTSGDTALVVFYNLRKPLGDSIFASRDTIKINHADSFYTNNQALKYKWTYGDTSHITDTLANTRHIYHQLGSYKVTLIGNGGICGKDTAYKTIVVVDHYTGLNTVKPVQHAVKLYPNPATQNFTLTGISALPSAVNVYNLLGQQILCNYEYSGGKLVVFTNQLVNGQYFIRVVAGGNTMTHRFTKD